jgi:hypothetical protein
MMDTGIAIRTADITGTKVRSHLCLAAPPGRDDGYAAAGCALMAQSSAQQLSVCGFGQRQYHTVAAARWHRMDGDGRTKC